MEKYSCEVINDRFSRREKDLMRTISGQKRHELLFEPYNVTPMEYRVLVFLVHNSDGAEPSVIADSMGVLRQTMTKVIDSLEKKGFVIRKLHPTDRRRVFVFLCPEGLEVSKKLLDLETYYSVRVERHFSSEELEEYNRLFQKMQDARDEELRLILEERRIAKSEEEQAV